MFYGFTLEKSEVCTRLGYVRLNWWSVLGLSVMYSCTFSLRYVYVTCMLRLSLFWRITAAGTQGCSLTLPEVAGVTALSRELSE